MQKQELLFKLRSQPDCFYNLQQTISLIESIDTQPPVAEKKIPEVLELGEVVNNLLNSIETKLDMTNRNKSLLDMDKNVFVMIANKVYLDDYEINTKSISYDIRAAVVEYFDSLGVKFVKSDDKPSDAEPDETPYSSEEQEFQVGDAELLAARNDSRETNI